MNYYNEIKEELINNEITKKVKNYSINMSDLSTYYKVGKLLEIASKHHGKKIIEEYSIKLSLELGKKYTTKFLKFMKRFYFTIKKNDDINN